MARWTTEQLKASKAGMKYLHDQNGQTFLEGVEPTRRDQLPKVSEDAIARDFAFLVRKLFAMKGISTYWTAVPLGEKRPPATAGKLKGMGANPGHPDYVFFWPDGIMLIELKTEKGALTESQKKVFPVLERDGYHVFICRSADAAFELVRARVAALSK